MSETAGQNAGVGTAGSGLLFGALERAGPAIFYLIGASVFVAGNVYFLRFNSVSEYASAIGLINVSFYGVLGGTIIGSGVVLARRNVPPERIPRATAWVGCGVAFLLLLNGPIMAFLASSVSPQFMYGWLLSVVGTGSTAGAVVGAVEARSIERAYLNQRLYTEREAAERHAEQLDYLNSLLRHEVLNNVSIIKGYAEYCLEADEKRPDELRVIHRQSREMADVISEVRVLLESLQGTYTLTERDLSAVLTEELENARSMAEPDVEIEADIPEGLGVLADDLLPRVFRNLLMNAIKHNDSPTPRIEVTVAEATDTVAVSVADNGPGVPESVQERLFQRSQRVDHGLGLYLVHELVARYGGDIDLVATGPTGAEFQVTLHRATGQAEIRRFSGR